MFFLTNGYEGLDVLHLSISEDKWGSVVLVDCVQIQIS